MPRRKKAPSSPAAGSLAESSSGPAGDSTAPAIQLPPRPPASAEEESADAIATAQIGDGRDEMNLAEFPFATLAHRGDERRDIVHEGWITDRNGQRLHQKWVVGGGVLGLPTEFDERVYVALMKITHDNGFTSRKVPFSLYQILKTMGVSIDQPGYERVETALKRLVGVTIYAEGAFWDNEAKEWVKAKSGFHIVERYWLRTRETSERIREQEGVPAYIIWSEDIWSSFRAGYVKRLDLDFFYSLNSALARRLYRFLDKRMRYQIEYEIDVFELAGRLGMARYDKPSRVRDKLQPAFDELITRGWLASAAMVKRGHYSRIRFVRATPSAEEVSDDPIQLALPAPEDDIWGRALRYLEGTMTKATYTAWFPRTRLDSLVGGVAVLAVPNDSTRDWLANRLDRLIREALASCGYVVNELRFKVPPETT